MHQCCLKTYLSAPNLLISGMLRCRLFLPKGPGPSAKIVEMLYVNQKHLSMHSSIAA